MREASGSGVDCSEAAAKGVRWFIDLSPILESGDRRAYRCGNCRASFHPDSRDVFNAPEESLRLNSRFLPPRFRIDDLGLPPELFSIIVDECSLFNRVCGIVPYGLPDEWKWIYLDGSFRDGHMGSSWVDHHPCYQDGVDRSAYVCKTVRMAISAEQPSAEQARLSIGGW